jgi:hypothetical protein
MPEYPKPHLRVPADRKQIRFKGNGRGKFKRRDLSREQHAARLLQQLGKVKNRFDEEWKRRTDSHLSEDFGLLLNIQSAPGYSLKLDSLEKKPSKTQDGIYLLNVRHSETEKGVIASAAVLVPFGQLKILEKKVSAYENPQKDTTDKKGNKSPKHATLLANIDFIGVAALEALWTEQEPLPEDDSPVWWELWISRAPRAESKARSWLQLFEETSRSLQLEVNQFRLRLPDVEIVLLKATRAQLEGSVDLLNTLTEVRKARTCSIDLSALPGSEQFEWIEEALRRIQWPDLDAPAVCLLDTGVNREHPLLSNVLSEEDMDTILPQMGTADHPNPGYAHGTPMAGLAAFDDLRNLMESNKPWLQIHRLESVKLIHDGTEHEPKNYGAVTSQAIVRPEITHPHRRRVYCLAVTRRDFLVQGRPSSWSAGIDAGAAGTNEEFQPKRVIFVSAGNHRDFLNNYSYPDSNKESPIEDPAQAWNGITVGAMTRRCEITEEDDESRRARAIARHEELSPFSRTSVDDWDPRWPIKPDIVMEGGNLARTESGNYIERDSLELISTASNFMVRPLCSMNGTSAAAASAARMGAMLMARFPGYRSETYRGLIVHSAHWQPNMLSHVNPHTSRSSEGVQRILRLYGFGEPHQPRLFGSGESGVTLIIEDTIQPYDPDSEAGKAKLGYFNLHELPWPKEVFDQYRDVDLTLTVTLSYFIDPNPGSRCWDKSMKYRYASHLLRFDFKRADESEDVFRKALEKRVEEEEEGELLELNLNETRSPSDYRWALGPKLRGKAGSLVQDVWKGSPADLAAMGQVAVYPAKGWFATRSFPEDHEFYNCHQRKVPYSLIISIDAEQEIGLYSSISNIISVDV